MQKWCIRQPYPNTWLLSYAVEVPNIGNKPSGQNLNWIDVMVITDHRTAYEINEFLKVANNYQLQNVPSNKNEKGFFVKTDNPIPLFLRYQWVLDLEGKPVQRVDQHVGFVLNGAIASAEYFCEAFSIFMVQL